MSRLNFYHEALSDQVRANVESHLQLLPEEQLSLLEEVAIQREFTKADLTKCFEAQKTMLEAKALYETTNSTQALVAYTEAEGIFNALTNKAKESFKSQADLNQKAAAVKDRVTKTITQSTITFLIQVVMQLVYEKFHRGDFESNEKFLEFENELRNRVVIEEASGQSLAIEAEYQEMLDSVPEWEG